MVVVEANLFFIKRYKALAAITIKNPERNKSAAYKLLLSSFKASKKLIPKDLSGCCWNNCNNLPSMAPAKSNELLNKNKTISNPNEVADAFHKLVHCLSLSVVKNPNLNGLAGLATVGAGAVIMNHPVSLYRAYLNSLGAETGFRLNATQVNLLANDLRTNHAKVGSVSGERLIGARKEFENRKAALRSEWEQQTGRKWPKYSQENQRRGLVPPNRQVGHNYDAHHIRQLNDGGQNKWWNITPQRGGDHQNTHGGGGILGAIRDFFSRLFG